MAAVLSQYFASSVPAEMMAAIAEDWHEELRDFPAWALQKAFRWWMGEGNEKRRQKPLPGDIAARARVEMGAVKVAESALRRFRQGVDAGRFEPEPQPERVSKDAAARILEEAGFTAKRFGGGA